MVECGDPCFWDKACQNKREAVCNACEPIRAMGMAGVKNLSLYEACKAKMQETGREKYKNAQIYLSEFYDPFTLAANYSIFLDGYSEADFLRDVRAREEIEELEDIDFMPFVWVFIFLITILIVSKLM